MLFNFQSPVSFVHSLEVNSFIISRGFEFVKHFFWKSFKFFVLLSATKKHLIFSLPWGLLTSCDVLSRWQLIYNIMPKLFCQHLFSKKLHFFEKKGKNPLFPPFYAGFWLILFLSFSLLSFFFLFSFCFGWFLCTNKKIPLYFFRNFVYNRKATENMCP